MERTFTVGDIYAMPSGQIIHCPIEGKIVTSQMYVVTCEVVMDNDFWFRFTNGDVFAVRRCDIAPIGALPQIKIKTEEWR